MEYPAEVTKIPPQVGPSPIVRRISVHAQRCRCGSRIGRGVPYLAVEARRPILEGLLEGVGFCSLGCVRAHMLETLATLEQLDTPRAESVVHDLREMYVETAALFSRVLEEGRPSLRESRIAEE